MTVDTAERQRLMQMAGELMRLAGPCRHGPDFASVVWFGTRYTFTGGQARVVRVLWQAWEHDTPDVRSETLLEAAGSESRRLASLFRDNPAWGAMIVPGPLKGLYRLAEPGPHAKPPESDP